MRRELNLTFSVILCLLCAHALCAQQVGSGSSSNPASPATATPPISSQPAAGTIPRLVKFSGLVKDVTGNPATGSLGLTFALYELPEGGTPLWTENQNLSLDAQGRYTALLGANSPNGLPLDLFTSSEALWLGVQPQLPGAVEQPRVLLVAVPYALKSSDADTLGGLPASAFMLAPSTDAAASVVAPNLPVTLPPPGPVQPPGSTSGTAGSGITGAGTNNFAAMFTGRSTVGSSSIYVNPSGFVGIGTTNPTAPLAVNGSAIFGGTLGTQELALPATTGATAGAITLGGNSFAHAFGTNNTFLGSSAGNFSMGGSDNTASGYQALHSDTGGNQNTAIGAQALSSNTMGSWNTASGTGALNSNTTGEGNTASGIFALGYNTTGIYNTANGDSALPNNTTGSSNTASGVDALFYNTTAAYNTAVGDFALGYNCAEVASGCNANFNTALGYWAGVPTNGNSGNTTGANNTFVGANSGPGTAANLNNATAIGANALVSESNALVLGSINGLNGATSNVNVGVGTATPAHALDVAGDIRASTNISAGGNLTVGGTIMGSGMVTLGNANNSFSGNGSGLTSLNPASLSAGTAGINITGSAANASELGGVAASSYARTDIGNTFASTNIFGASVGFGSTPNSQALVDINGTQTEASNNEVLLRIDGTLNSSPGNSYSTALGVYPTTTMTGYTNYNMGIDVSLAATGNQIAHSVVAVNVNQPSAVNGSDCVVSFGINVPNQSAPCTTPQPTPLNYGFFENGVSGTMNYFASPLGLGTATPQYTLDVHGTGNFTGLVNFASGQAFPGTITGITTAAESGLLGGGNSGTLSLSVDPTVYLSLSAAASTYLMQASAASTYLPQSTAASTYLPLAGGTLTGTLNLPANGLQLAGNQIITTNGQTSFGASPVSYALVDIAGTFSESNYHSHLLEVNGTASSTPMAQAYLKGMEMYPNIDVANGYANYAIGLDVGIGAVTGSQIVESVAAIQATQPTAINGSGCVVAIGINVPNQVPTQCSGTYGFYQQGSASYNYFGSNVGIGTSTPAYALDVVGDVNLSGCLIAAGGTYAGICSSDARLKTNIQPLQSSLDKLAELQPVRFDWRAENPARYRFGTSRAAGLIAQNVQKVFPDMVTTDAHGYLQVNYSVLPFMLLEGVRELKARNDDLRTQVGKQQEQIANLNRQAATKDAEVAALADQNRQLAAEVEQLRKAQEQTAALLAHWTELQAGTATALRAQATVGLDKSQ